jgi:hypothetical protein
MLKTARARQTGPMSECAIKRTTERTALRRCRGGLRFGVDAQERVPGTPRSQS